MHNAVLEKTDTGSRRVGGREREKESEQKSDRERKNKRCMEKERTTPGTPTGKQDTTFFEPLSLQVCSYDNPPTIV